MSLVLSLTLTVTEARAASGRLMSQLVIVYSRED